MTLKLMAGETLLWQGRPQQGVLFQPADVWRIPFSLLWAGFAVFWNVAAWTGSAPLTFSLFGLPFLAMGVFLVFGRFWLDSGLRRRISYAVTDRRIVIAREAPWASVRSLDLGNLAPPELIEGAEGRGSIRFGGAESPFNAGMPGMSSVPQFIGIEGGR